MNRTALPADDVRSVIEDRRRAWLFAAAVAALSSLLVWWSWIVVGPGWLWPATVGLGTTLLALTVIDYRTFRLPDLLTYPLLLAGLLVGYILHPAMFFDHVIGAGAGFLALWGLNAIYRAYRGRDGVGLGDAKLLAAGGAWLAWPGLTSVLLIASLASLVALLFTGRLSSPEDRNRPLPYGPGLALGIWLVWLYGPVGGGM